MANLFDKIFGTKTPAATKTGNYFETLTAYQPVFYSQPGCLYESEVVRSAIHARANHISKLKVEVSGAAQPALRNKLKHGPNEFMRWSQFLYRLSTILDMQNTAFIVPVFDEYGRTSGIYPILPTQTEVVSSNGKPWLRYHFNNGKVAAVEMDLVGIMTKMQYKDDFFGEKNGALIPTMELISMQNQGIQEGVKSAATYRFMAQMNNFSKAEDLAKERKRFTKENLSGDVDNGGLLLFPASYSNIQQIKSSPFVVDADQMKLIQTNVYNYFGVNEDILQNKAIGDTWNAFYEGAIESFSIQLSEVLSRMLFTFREQSEGNEVHVTANRIQYMSNNDKLNYATNMLDRGIMSMNEVREMLQLPPVDGGDVRIIRGEYYSVDEKVDNTAVEDENQPTEEGNNEK